MMIVYLITNKITGKHYVGQTINSLKERWQGHCDDSRRKNTPLYAAMRKYGIDAFSIEPICTKVESENTLNALETWYIGYYKSIAPDGYNLAPGGTIRLGPRSIQKMSKSLKGRKLSPEHIANIAAASKRRWTDPEYKARLSKIQSIAQLNSDYIMTEEHRRKIAYWKGKKQPAEMVARRVATIKLRREERKNNETNN